MTERKKILIAENEELNLEFLELMLSKLGFAVERADEGTLLLKIIKREKIDLVLINTILPEVSGWEILKTIKNDAKLSGIPVILLSDMDNVKEKVEAYELGAEDFIAKPFNFSVLLSRIRSALRKRELFLQIALRQERLLLAEKVGLEINGRLKELINALDGACRNAVCDDKEKIFAALDEIKILQKSIDVAYEEGAKIKGQEIGLSVLERPEVENKMRKKCTA
ncbi:MAG: response regulator [Spirochaetaceae bacterium]|jgi:DNA-binding response OmpR family regulator|nr:response regulator [Spirochaetaceae bacterium]